MIISIGLSFNYRRWNHLAFTLAYFSFFLFFFFFLLELPVGNIPRTAGAGSHCAVWIWYIFFTGTKLERYERTVAAPRGLIFFLISWERLFWKTRDWWPTLSKLAVRIQEKVRDSFKSLARQATWTEPYAQVSWFLKWWSRNSHLAVILI